MTSLTYRESLDSLIRQGLCNTTNTAAATAALGSRFWGAAGFNGLAETSAQASQFWSNASGIFCNRPRQDTTGEISEPFTGGQCPEVPYLITGDFVSESPPGSTPVVTPVQNNGPGPITVQTVPQEDGVFQRLVDGNGDFLLVYRVSNENQVASLENINIQRTDGQPDDCGNPPDVGPVYVRDDFTVTDTVNYTDDSGNPQSENVEIVYKPITVNEDGDFIVPFEINFDDDSKQYGDINVTDIDITIGGGNSGGDGVQPTPRELGDDEDPPEGTTIIGVRVLSSVEDVSRANVTELFSDDGGENLFVPRLGGVLFTLEGESGSAESVFSEFKTLDSVILSPKPAKSVRLFARAGVASVKRLLVVPTASLCCRN